MIEDTLGWLGVVRYVLGAVGFDCDCGAQLEAGEPSLGQCSLCRPGSVATPAHPYHPALGRDLAFLLCTVLRQY